MRYHLTIWGEEQRVHLMSVWFDTLDEALAFVCEECLEGVPPPFRNIAYCAIREGAIHRIIISRSFAREFIKEGIDLITIVSERYYLEKQIVEESSLN